MSASRDCEFRVRAAVAAALFGSASLFSYSPQATAAEAEAEEEVTELEEVRVTGSRIVRKDIQANSPLVTVDRQKLEDNSYVSIEQALNELPSS
jgi:outer membrane cobalamin receptor